MTIEQEQQPTHTVKAATALVVQARANYRVAYQNFKHLYKAWRKAEPHLKALRNLVEYYYQKEKEYKNVASLAAYVNRLNLTLAQEQVAIMAAEQTELWRQVDYGRDRLVTTHAVFTKATQNLLDIKLQLRLFASIRAHAKAIQCQKKHSAPSAQ
jgi:hypothetical protein